MSQLPGNSGSDSRPKLLSTSGQAPLAPAPAARKSRKQGFGLLDLCDWLLSSHQADRGGNSLNKGGGGWSKSTDSPQMTDAPVSLSLSKTDFLSNVAERGCLTAPEFTHPPSSSASRNGVPPLNSQEHWSDCSSVGQVQSSCCLRVGSCNINSVTGAPYGTWKTARLKTRESCLSRYPKKTSSAQSQH